MFVCLFVFFLAPPNFVSVLVHAPLLRKRATVKHIKVSTTITPGTN